MTLQERIRRVAHELETSVSVCDTIWMEGDGNITAVEELRLIADEVDRILERQPKFTTPEGR